MSIVKKLSKLSKYNFKKFEKTSLNLENFEKNVKFRKKIFKNLLLILQLVLKLRRLYYIIFKETNFYIPKQYFKLNFQTIRPTFDKIF